MHIHRLQNRLQNGIKFNHEFISPPEGKLNSKTEVLTLLIVVY